MSKFAGFIVGAIEVGVGILTHNPALIISGALMIVSQAATDLLMPTKTRQAQALQVQTGEVPRSGIFGEGGTAGSLVDAFNYGGKNGTDWTAFVFALADHVCESLVGFYVNDTFVTFSGDGTVPDPSDKVQFRGQLQVFWRNGAGDQDVPDILLDNAPVVDGTPTWTPNDRGRSVAYVVVAFKADKSDAKHPVWSAGEPNFIWVVKGLRCYIAREDDTVGGAGAHRWDDPTTREWSANPIDCRQTWERGIYAGDKVDQPEMLLLGRGLSDTEAPATATFAPGNLCDEIVQLKGVLSSLAVAAREHDTTIQLTNVTGLSNGMSILISQEGGFDETLTVEGISGDNVTLSAGLAFDHPALTVVSWSSSSDKPAGEPRYTIGGVFGGSDAYIDTENAIAAACGGYLVEREGSVQMVPGAAQPVLWHITDEDLIVGSSVAANDFRSTTDDLWCNSVAAKYVEPSQKWADHSAPIRRVIADIQSDGQPRLVQPNLSLCTSGTQAQRVSEQMRRMGRLPRTRSLVLGPRFIGAEHGDWLVWTSKRYGPRPTPAPESISTEDGNATGAEAGGNVMLEATPLLFRIESDGQDEKWQNSLQLRQIAADIADWDPQVDELADGAVAVQPGDPAFGSAPAAGSWTLTGATETGDGGQVAALVFVGACDDDQADAIIFEYAAGAAEPDVDDDSAWTVGTTALNISTTRAEVAGVMAGTNYWGAVSYRVSGVQGDRLPLGPVMTPSVSTDGRIESETGSRVLGEDGSQILKE
jgi:hypothetical protein